MSYNQTQISGIKPRNRNHEPENGSKAGTFGKEEEECSSTCHCEEKSENEVQNGVIDTVWRVGCYKINPTTLAGIQCYVICNVRIFFAFFPLTENDMNYSY